MKIIKHDLLTKQKSRKYNLKVEIDLYPYAAELYAELEKIGIVDRIKDIPQLGVIKVPKKLQKTRYDYVMLQSSSNECHSSFLWIQELFAHQNVYHNIQLAYY